MSTTFKPDHIVPDLKASTGFEAIDEIVDRLAAAGAVPPAAKAPIADALKQRERSMSTGIGFGVAVPHAASESVSEVVLAFGRSSRGVDFGSLDQQPVKLVALMIVPAGQREKHLPMLARISRLFHRKDARQALEAAGDAAAIARLLNENLPTGAAAAR